MTLEVEAKFRVESSTLVFLALEMNGWKVALPVPFIEEDLYFQGIGRDFRQTGEALRLRIQNGEPKFTYKGKPSENAGGFKVRREIELSIRGCTAEEATDFLTELGFNSVAKVRKARQVYEHVQSWPGMNVHFDEVDGIGLFVEIEILAKEGEQGEALEKIEKVAGLLGLYDKEPRSYLRMVLEKQELGQV